MKIIILSSGSRTSSTQKLVKGLKSEKNVVQVLDPQQLSFSLGPTQIKNQGKLIKVPDMVLPRLGWLTLNHGLVLLQALEAAGVRSLNSADAIRLVTHKLNCLSVLARAGLPIPTTHFAANITEGIYQLGQSKKSLVIKTLKGSQGMGVALTKTPSEFKALVDLLRTESVPFLVQEFIKGTEIRVLVFQGRILGAMKRTPPRGEFRSNISQGGKGSSVRLTEEEKNLALQAVSVTSLDLAGVDLIRTPKKSLILEVNAFPGLHGISTTLGQDFGLQIARSLDKGI